MANGDLLSQLSIHIWVRILPKSLDGIFPWVWKLYTGWNLTLLKELYFLVFQVPVSYPFSLCFFLSIFLSVSFPVTIIIIYYLGDGEAPECAHDIHGIEFRALYFQVQCPTHCHLLGPPMSFQVGDAILICQFFCVCSALRSGLWFLLFAWLNWENPKWINKSAPQITGIIF